MGLIKIKQRLSQYLALGILCLLGGNNWVILGDYRVWCKINREGLLILYGVSLPTSIGQHKVGQPKINDVIQLSTPNKTMFAQVKGLARRRHKNTEFRATCELLLDTEGFNCKFEVNSIQNLGKLLFKGMCVASNMYGVCYGQIVSPWTSEESILAISLPKDYEMLSLPQAWFVVNSNLNGLWLPNFEAARFDWIDRGS